MNNTFEGIEISPKIYLNKTGKIRNIYFTCYLSNSSVISKTREDNPEKNVIVKPSLFITNQRIKSSISRLFPNLSEFQKNRKEIPMGFIRASIDGSEKLIELNRVYPLAKFEEYFIRKGIGSLVEFACSGELLRNFNDYKIIFEKKSHSKERIRQLKKIGIKLNKKYPLGEYVHKLKNYINNPKSKKRRFSNIFPKKLRKFSRFLIK